MVSCDVTFCSSHSLEYPHTHLHARVANGAAPEVVQANAIVLLLWQQHQQIPFEHALVPVEVHADDKAGDLARLEGGSLELDKVRN